MRVNCPGVRQFILATLIYTGCLVPVSAQFDASYLVNQTSAYLNKAAQEKLFLHLSKSHFLTGETIWFRAFHYSLRDHQPIAFSKVLYVELIDSKNISTIQIKIKIDSSGGSGSINLPVNLNSGRYRIRAYTNWMKNFDNSPFYSSEILIINPFKRLDLHTDTTNTNFDLQFFPEGGYVVGGITSRVGFKGIDQRGKGVNFKGILRNNVLDTLVTFKSNRFGIGSFTITPQAQAQYHANIIDSDGNSWQFAFPDIMESGYVMRVESGDSSYNIQVIHENPSSDQDKKIYLAVISRDKFLLSETKTITSNREVFDISSELFNEGINQLTIFNSIGQPVCERLVFKYPKGSLKISAEVSDVRPGQREEMEIKLTTTNQLDQVLRADMSVSIFRSDPMIELTHYSFETYMWLLSELKGHVEDPDYYFSKMDDQIIVDMDNLMLTQGWRMYDLDKIIGMAEASFKYTPEFVDQTISGKVMRKGAGENEPVAGEIIYLSFPNSYSQLFAFKSDHEGSLFFETKDIYGENELVIRSQILESSEYEVSIESPFENPETKYKWAHFEISPSLESFLVDQSVNMQVENSFIPPEIKENPRDTLSFYNIPDASYLLDEFTRFPVMEEVMREYVYNVFVRRENGKFVFRVVDLSRNVLMEEPPLVLLDGVPVFDIDEIMNIDPLKIRKIDVVHSKYYYGHLDCYGIVAFYSYNSDLPDYSLDDNSLRLNYEGFQENKTFYSPKYSNADNSNNRVPDFRNQLHWDPKIHSDENGECTINFFTSDATGTYTIQIHGLSENGLPGSFQSSFEVVEK